MSGRRRGWELGSPLSPDRRDMAQLSLDQRRQLNIERNNRFLETLNIDYNHAAFFSPVASAPTPTAEMSAKDRFRSLKAKQAELQTAFPQRVDEILQLWEHFSLSSHSPPLYLYGSAETGKTTVLRALLSALDISLIFIDCRLISDKEFVTVLCQSASTVLKMSFRREPRNLQGFLVSLQNSANEQKKRVCLVLKQPNTTLMTNMDLQSMLPHCQQSDGKVDICILTRAIPGAQFHCCKHIFFPAYGGKEIGQLLQRHNSASSVAFSAVLCERVVQAALPFTCSKLELLVMLRQLTNIQAEGGGLMGSQAVTKAVHAMISLKSPSMYSLSMHQQLVSSAERKDGTPMDSGFLWALNLPTKLRCLLLAAYMAARNPPTSDNITMLGESTVKRRKQQGAVAKTADTNLETRLFSAERLLSIFAQVYNKVQGTQLADYADVNSQVMIASMVRRGVFYMASGSQFKLQIPKYGCRISHSLAEALARPMNFMLGDHLVNSNVSKYSFR